MLNARIQSSKRIALVYLSVAMTIPFLMPIKHTITHKDDQSIGYFGVGGAFRI
ncbi:uncharacterized protein C5L36_0D05465 [Pichia kudriavzevii]|uniref:Uncharacterized protein n=1 Tax=Pichia kudriavzevii TaxID=4909 RepID=A0A2U9R8Q6_PICKU|nr:uncharacterized protein C5L36_0D05465 [Pichia kudriavzevii]AWU77820.1 hypothetical protein C5L36_0D05465 [Pichia kudriavzevii]